MYIQETVRLDDLTSGYLDVLRALGVDTIHLELRGGGGTGVSRTPLAQKLKAGQDCTADFEQARDQVEAAGLKLNNIFMACWEEITLGAPDSDEKIDHWCRMLASLGRAGIPCLGWNFKPMGNFRTPSDTGRGGAKYSTFDRAAFEQDRPPQHEPPVDEAQMWARMEGFLQAVIPAAEAAGVRMALHPDDPPVPEPLGGVAQICSTLEQFRRTLFEIAPSPANAMLFCQGCMTELLGPEKIYGAIAEIAAKDAIAWVHFRNVQGQLPRFTEVFIDEGEVDMRRAMATFRDNGFAGPYMMDHTPTMPEGANNLVGKAYAIGYIRALIQDVYG